MKVLVVGDVHGCYYTFKKLLKVHWDPETEFLVQLGDLINKGPHSGKCLKFWFGLERKYPYQVFMLKGNHERMVQKSFLMGSTDKLYHNLLENLAQEDMKVNDVVNWIKKLPLKWETPELFLSHAGISKAAVDPEDQDNPSGMLLNRGPLKRLKQIQVVGHTVVNGNKPVFSPSENAWRLDTGAYTKGFLSALKFSHDKSQVDVIRMETRDKDKKEKSFGQK